MIIYGTRSSHLHSEQLTQEKCPNCDAKGSVYAGIFSRYFHVFWIPFFPIGKSAVTQCQTCKHAMKEREMPVSFRNFISEAKSRIAVPRWHFSGLALVVLLVVWIAYTGSQSKEQEQVYIKSPKVGDVYRYKLANNYSTFKVVNVTEDSVVVYPNQYESTKMAGIYQIDKPENYMIIPMSYSLDELTSMYKEGTIYSIDR